MHNNLLYIKKIEYGTTKKMNNKAYDTTKQMDQLLPIYNNMDRSHKYDVVKISQTQKRTYCMIPYR